jgi:hypothetical protein
MSPKFQIVQRLLGLWMGEALGKFWIYAVASSDEAFYNHAQHRFVRSAKSWQCCWCQLHYSTFDAFVKQRKCYSKNVVRTSALGADNCIALLGSPLCWELNLHLDGRTAGGCAWSLAHPSHSSTQVAVNGHQRERADGHYPKLLLNTNSIGGHRRGLGKLESAEFIISTFCPNMPGDLLGLSSDTRERV